MGVGACPASHPSGAPALILRLTLGSKVIAYTGDTAWTPAIAETAAGADPPIAEAYYWDKAVPHHLRHADLAAHQDKLTAGTVLNHMSETCSPAGNRPATKSPMTGWSCGCDRGEARRPARSGWRDRPRYPAASAGHGGLGG